MTNLPLDNRVLALLNATPFGPCQLVKLVKLFGQASYREYFRITCETGSTFVLMKMPPGVSSVAEEITKADKKFDELPFVNIQKYLHRLDLPVAAIVASSPDEELLILEDLGDDLLEKVVQKASGDQMISLYKKALELLVRLQKKTRGNPSEACVAFFRRFDEDLLFWEWNHFIEYGLGDRLQIKISGKEKKIFGEIGHDVCTQISAFPYGFTHRDFQSRNLMIKNNEFYMIDFQDALIGPVVYDLVGLLRDSYVELDEATLTKLQTAYLDLLDPSHPYFQKKEELIRHFDLMTLQRKLKDTGRFQYIHTVKKNSSFLTHVPTSVKYVKRALQRIGKYPELEEILAKYLPEFL